MGDSMKQPALTIYENSLDEARRETLFRQAVEWARQEARCIASGSRFAVKQAAE